MVKGSIRKGISLLSGLLRCGICGRKFGVGYSGTSGKVIRYTCRGHFMKEGIEKCQTLGGLKIEEAVSKAVLEVLSPHGIRASVTAIKARAEKGKEEIRQIELSLTEAKYEAERAKRQYDKVEPENRLVAAELERRWNQALDKVNELEEKIECGLKEKKELGEKEKEEILSLGKNIDYVWNHEKSDIEVKKRIVRAVIKEIIVTRENDKIKLIIHWEGGDHSKIIILMNKSGRTRWVAGKEIIELMGELARILSDKEIAKLLNRIGKKTPTGKSWIQSRVTSFRNTHNIKVFNKEELKDRGEIYVKEASEILGVPISKIYWLMKNKILSAKQVCKGAPYIIKLDDIKNKQKELLMICKSKTGKCSPLQKGQQELFPYIIKT